MNENSVCPIWGTVASVNSSLRFTDLFVDGVDSPRAGGEYFISEKAKKALSNQGERFKARLTSWLVEQRRLGVQQPKITQETIEEVEIRRDLTVHERADRLLQHMQKETSFIGEVVVIAVGRAIKDNEAHYKNVVAAYAQSESIDSHEVSFLLNYLVEQNWLRGPYPNVETINKFILTVEGYARLAELEKIAVDSSQAFVAMWFDDSMKYAYENGIKPGIEDAGYEPLPINRKEHINKIDDEIIAEIRRSRFLVADFTYKDIEEIENCKDKEELKKVGARGGVYYEAGFAHGLNIPVIFTCRADLVEKVHFDTRQYNHITWEENKLEEFRKALSDRISAVIGDGPHKAQDA